MDSAAQLPAFLCLAAAGAAAGLIYDVLSPLRFSKISAFIADVLFFLLAAVLYVLIATFCRLPDFRLYAYFAMTAGFIIYLKSMRSVVAFFGKMCYNTNHSNSIGKEKKGKCDMITQNLKYVQNGRMCCCCCN